MKLKLTVIIVAGIVAFSCKKKVKDEPPADPGPTPNPPAATIYTVTGKMSSYHCYNISQGKVYLNAYVSEADISSLSALPSASIQPNGSFTFTYSSAASYTSINFAYVIQNYQGDHLFKRTKTVAADQSCDIGTYDFNTMCHFYVRFKSLSNSPITNLDLNSEQFVIQNQGNYIPFVGGPFTDTTLAYQHDMYKGFWQQDLSSGYDSLAQNIYTEIPITFTCTYNSVQYIAQKNISKCNQAPLDTILINLP
jgi:hypothetical protein